MRGYKNRVSRWGELVLVPVSGHSIKDLWVTERLYIAPPVAVRTQLETVRHLNISNISRSDYNRNYILEEVYCLPHARYSAEDKEITLLETKEGPHAVLFFAQNFKYPEITELNSKESMEKLEEILSQKEPSFSYGYYRKGVSTRDIIKGYSLVEMNSRQPRFAVLLGGNTTDHRIDLKHGLWTKFIHILDESKANEDFHALLKRNAELVRHCATRSQVISALINQEFKKSFLWDISKDIEYHRWIQPWEELFEVNGRAKIRYSKYIYYFICEYVRDVIVGISVQADWRNYMERNVVISLNIYAPEDQWRELWTNENYRTKRIIL